MENTFQSNVATNEFCKKKIPKIHKSFQVARVQCFEAVKLCLPKLRNEKMVKFC